MIPSLVVQKKKIWMLISEGRWNNCVLLFPVPSIGLCCIISSVAALILERPACEGSSSKEGSKFVR